jgi:hypothetical protein
MHASLLKKGKRKNVSFKQRFIYETYVDTNGLKSGKYREASRLIELTVEGFCTIFRPYQEQLRKMALWQESNAKI